jgi:smad nuclear-interacting protein 1
VVLKFTEPLDAAAPEKDEWTMYPFKGDQSIGKSLSVLSSFDIDPIKLGPKSSVYLFGRDNRVADILLENPSCSMQHAVLQFREKHVTRTLSTEEQTARGLF